jgi:hypothetical protein
MASIATERKRGFVPPQFTMLWRQPFWRIMRKSGMIRFGAGHSHLNVRGAAIP